MSTLAQAVEIAEAMATHKDAQLDELVRRATGGQKNLDAAAVAAASMAVAADHIARAIRALPDNDWAEGRDYAVRQVEHQIMAGYPDLPLGEKCAHGVLSGHDCCGCYDEALMTRLTAIRAAQPTAPPHPDQET